MEQKLVRVKVKSLTDNIFKLLDDDWMLVTAGKMGAFNAMTASWGSFGMLWNKPIAVCFIRPQRYTFEFVNKSEFFTLSFFSERYHDALNFFGNHSGRTTDKMSGSGLAPASTENGSVYFKEARIVLECRKLYADQLKAGQFIKTSLINEIYPKNDFHHFFVGEIINCYATDVVLKGIDNRFDDAEGDSLP